MARRKKKLRFVVRPWAINPCPGAEDLRLAWTNRRRSQKDFVWLLSVLGELTCYTDRTLECLGGLGNIAGRKGGLKRFIERETPELLAKYKSISRYASLAYRLKRAFVIYPPAELSLMHPALPLPRINMPFLTNHARKVFRTHLAELPPEYAAYDRYVRSHEKRKGRPKFKWGPPLPQADWPEAERRWRRKVLLPVVQKDIERDHSFYSRDYLF